MNISTDQNDEKRIKWFSGGGYAFLVYLAIALAQFQNISVVVYGSKYDITCFLLLMSLGPLILLAKQKFVAFIVIVAFIGLQITVWIFFQVAPFYRLVSGLIWFGGFKRKVQRLLI